MEGTGKSSSAEEAAKAIAARTSSGFKEGKSARMSCRESPSARLARTVRYVTWLSSADVLITNDAVFEVCSIGIAIAHLNFLYFARLSYSLIEIW
jgi:hypothetical protein